MTKKTLDDVHAVLKAHAAEMAAYAGVPLSVVHIHGAVHQVTTLLLQARDRCLRELRAVPVQVVPPEAEPEAEPAPKPKRAKTAKPAS